MNINKELIRVAKQISAMEFPTKEALKTYLDQHPLAKRENHSVKPFSQKKNLSPKEKKVIEESMTGSLRKNIQGKDDGSFVINSSKILSDLKSAFDRIKTKEELKVAITALKIEMDSPWSYTGGIANQDSDKVGDILSHFLKSYKFDRIK